MGHISVVYGCIQSPSDYGNCALMCRLNGETLAALPVQGETFSPVDEAFPVTGGWSAHQVGVQTTPLSPVRSMFGISPEDRDPIYHWDFLGGPRSFQEYFGPK